MDPPAGDESANSTTVVSEDVPCHRCGYNLRGLALEGHCPECGLDIAGSVYGRLRYADDRWIRSAVDGAGIVLLAGVMNMVIPVAVIVLAILFGIESYIVQNLYYVMAGLTGGLTSLGYWRLTRKPLGLLYVQNQHARPAPHSRRHTAFAMACDRDTGIHRR